MTRSSLLLVALLAVAPSVTAKAAGIGPTFRGLRSEVRSWGYKREARRIGKAMSASTDRLFRATSQDEGSTADQLFLRAEDAMYEKRPLELRGPEGEQLFVASADIVRISNDEAEASRELPDADLASTTGFRLEKGYAVRQLKVFKPGQLVPDTKRPSELAGYSIVTTPGAPERLMAKAAYEFQRHRTDPDQQSLLTVRERQGGAKWTFDRIDNRDNLFNSRDFLDRVAAGLSDGSLTEGDIRREGGKPFQIDRLTFTNAKGETIRLTSSEALARFRGLPGTRPIDVVKGWVKDRIVGER